MTETNAAVATVPAAFEASQAPSGQKGGKGLTVAIGIAAVVTVIGIVCWIMQLTGGMSQTGMRNLDSWGLYITCFMFFVGLSAGGLIISSIPNAFGIEGFGGISKVAIWSAVCCTVAAIGFVVVDLGQPTRLWELFAFANFSSPLMWDILVLGAYLILSCVYLWATLRVETGRMSHKAHRTLSVIALVIAISVHTVTAWIFSLGPAHEFWHTALMGPWFVASALVCGTALVMIVVIALRKAGYLDVEQNNIVKMAKMLAAFICVDLYFYACDLLTSGYFSGEGADVVAMLTAGPLAAFFWIQIILSIVALILCVVPGMRTNPLLIAAGLAAIVAVFCKRVQILVGGFQLSNIQGAAPVTTWQLGSAAESSMAASYGNMVYWPAPIEFGVALGVVALAVFLMLVGLKKLNLKPAE